MSMELGLRERKKEQTRRLIGEAAQRLFAERGFDAVTVAEVARAADVSEKTVYNYFPTKEDLFYDQMEVFETALLEAVRVRQPGESVLSAFRRFVLERSRGLADEERADVIAKAARLIAGSPALQAREREIVARSTQVLADLIAEETRVGAGEVEPWVVANALMGVQRALVEHVRTAVLAGNRGPSLAAGVRSAGKRAFARLEHGLADYAVQRAPLQGRPRRSPSTPG
jgi:AcrR family transcriptional regulator